MRSSLACLRSLAGSALILLLAACGGEGNGDAQTPSQSGPPNVIDPAPQAGNAVMPLFVRPFANEYPLLNYFDHDVPTAPETTNGYQLTWRGDRAQPGRDIGGYDGHTGIDWLLPENTPLFAVTNGEIVSAGEVTGPCFLEGGKVTTGLVVRLRFIASDGDTYIASYSHMNRIDVSTGNTVVEGEQVGLSGATGCLGNLRIAHVHFMVQRELTAAPFTANTIDPYGWEGPGADPWATNDMKKRSIWMWKPGQAPDMVPQRR